MAVVTKTVWLLCSILTRLLCQLFALTGVPPERQKITAGAKQITDATDLKTIGLKEKQVPLEAALCARIRDA